jgi:hypothetical protein
VSARGAPALLVLWLLASAAPAVAQTADQAPGAAETPAPKEDQVFWHNTTFVFQQRASTQTLGIGRDYQSSNPFYDWAFYLRPRVYFLERDEVSLSLRAQGLVTYEFTNSDSTTDQNEVVLEDTIVAFGPQFTPYEHGEYSTNLSIGLPRLLIPTSKASRGVGKILGVGSQVLLEQDVPLREGDTVFPRGSVQLRGGYSYMFTKSNVPENEDLDQLRVDMNGHVVSNDQLSGAALSDHAGSVHGIIEADVLRDRIGFSIEAGLDFAHKYPLSDESTLVLDTGPVEVPADENASRMTIINYLDAGVEFRFGQDLVTLTLGYENITAQIGPDGQHRSFFWSPDAKLYLSAELRLDTVYNLAAHPKKKRSAQRSASGKSL